MGRQVLSTKDIDEALAAGQRQVLVRGDAIVTQLAREYAQGKGVSLTSDPAGAGEPVVAAASPLSAEQPAVAPTPGAASSGATGADHAAVRAAVVAQLGGEPAGLDAAITKVLGR